MCLPVIKSNAITPLFGQFGARRRMPKPERPASPCSGIFIAAKVWPRTKSFRFFLDYFSINRTRKAKGWLSFVLLLIQRTQNRQRKSNNTLRDCLKPDLEYPCLQNKARDVLLQVGIVRTAGNGVRQEREWSTSLRQIKMNAAASAAKSKLELSGISKRLSEFKSCFKTLAKWWFCSGK